MQSLGSQSVAIGIFVHTKCYNRAISLYRSRLTEHKHLKAHFNVRLLVCQRARAIRIHIPYCHRHRLYMECAMCNRKSQWMWCSFGIQWVLLLYSLISFFFWYSFICKFKLILCCYGSGCWCWCWCWYRRRREKCLYYMFWKCQPKNTNLTLSTIKWMRSISFLCVFT